MDQSWEWAQPISEEIFNMKYKFHREDAEDVFSDIATAISKQENINIRNKIREDFYRIMIEGKFIPGGRIAANAWSGSPMKNLINCFTIKIEDDLGKIYDALKEDALIAKVGGGDGFDISPLRPDGEVLSVGGEASGPMSFLKVFDQSAKTILVGGARRGAHIALMDISHPNIREFITCKEGDKNKSLTQFNISVKISDKFIVAVKNDSDWKLEWGGKVYEVVKARELYDMLAKNAFEHNEPGIFNVDIVNKYNNGYWLYDMQQCNPCGEEVLPPYGACDLGSLNLTAFVKNSFTNEAYFDFKDFAVTISFAVRFLDNVLDISEYPLKKIKSQVHSVRQIGLGFTAFADALAMLTIKYGSEESKKFSNIVGKTLRDASYTASVALAEEKNPFPLCEADKLLESKFIKKLPQNIKDGIEKHGLRNIALNTVAPTGTISLSFGQNCSTGIEPVFELEYNRRIRSGKEVDVFKEQIVKNGSWLRYLKSNEDSEEVPDYFVTTKDINPRDAIDIQAIFQKYIDASISKTLNLQPGTTFEEYKELFLYAYESGLKGFTTFNPEGSLKGVLEYNEPFNNSNGNGYIKRRIAPERPQELECDIHEITVKDKKFLVLVGKLKGSIYEIFVDDNSNGSVNVMTHKHGIIKKQAKGKYGLVVKDNGNEVVIDNLAKAFDRVYGTLARFVSMSLRHGCPLQFVVDQLSKSKQFLGFERAVSRVLKKYIKDGEIVMTSNTCPECKSDLVYKEGCVSCQSCGWSLCS